MLRVHWSGSALEPRDGSYTARYPVALTAGPASLLVALPALVALARQGGEVRLVPELLMERGLSEAEQQDIERTLSSLASLIADSIAELYGERHELRYSLDVTGVPRRPNAPAREPDPSTPDGLMFGGGAESLLTLSRMIERKAPCLIGLCGPGWSGSDPEKNAHKLAFDQRVATQLNLQLERIETSAYAAISSVQPAWERGVSGSLFLANALAFAPIAIGVAAPLFDAGSIRSLHLGSERDHAGYHTVYCLSPEFLHRLAGAVAPLVSFIPTLTDRSKAQIVRELWQRSPQIARYQSSCFSSQSERWCHACEKCFRSYALLCAAGANPAEVEIDARRLHRNAPRFARALVRSIAFSSYHGHVYYELAHVAWGERRKALFTMLAPWIALAKLLRLRKKLSLPARATPR